MKKTILPLLISLLFFMTVDAEEWFEEDIWCCEDICCFDETPFYAKVLGGVNFLQNTSIQGNRASYQKGYIFAGSLGYSWCNGVRLEAEYAYRRNAISKIHFCGQGCSKRGHFQASSYMANLLWDLPLSTWWCAFGEIQPFLGAGIGYDFQKMHSANSSIIFNQKWRHFAWQVMAGFAFPIFCNAELTLEYQFHQGGCHFNNHSLGVGFIYQFDFLR